MLDIGWTEILIIAVIALFVVGPKDIPKALRTVGVWVGKLRSLSREFQSTVEDAVRDTELDEVKKQIESAKTEFQKNVNESVDPKGELTGMLKGVDEPEVKENNTRKSSSSWPLPLSKDAKENENNSISSTKTKGKDVKEDKSSDKNTS